MLEPWRSHYLHALGVEVYLPRFPLPGAASSLEPAWDDVVVVEQPVEVDELMSAAPAGRVQPDAEPVRVASGRNTSAPTATTSAAATPALRIKLAVAASDNGILIIDDATINARNDSQRLLTNLLFSLRGKPTHLKVEVFDWPLPNLRNRAIELNADAARETLSGLLRRKILDGDVRTILLLGDNAQRWIDAPLRQALAADRQLVWGMSISSAAVFGDLQRKRQWWLDLRGIATH